MHCYFLLSFFMHVYSPKKKFRKQNSPFYMNSDFGGWVPTGISGPGFQHRNCLKNHEFSGLVNNAEKNFLVDTRPFFRVPGRNIKNFRVADPE